jgi:hypothetical protein
MRIAKKGIVRLPFFALLYSNSKSLYLFLYKKIYYGSRRNQTDNTDW